MAGKSILSDTFEQLVELGRSTVKSTTQAVKGTPKKSQKSDKTASAESQILNRLENSARTTGEIAGSHTPLDMIRLEAQYKNQDQKGIDEVRQKLEFFRRYKDQEKQAIEERKRKVEERLQKIKMEEEEKKKKQEAGALKPIEAPHGKERRSILSPKKVAKRSQVETRAGSGKQ